MYRYLAKKTRARCPSQHPLATHDALYMVLSFLSKALVKSPTSQRGSRGLVSPRVIAYI